MSQGKSDIRRDMLRIRSALTPLAARTAGNAVIEGLISFLSQQNFPTKKRGITLFFPVRGEIDLLSDAFRLEESGFYICLPRINDDRMDFFRYRANDPLVTSSFGVPEPERDTSPVSVAQIAVAVCPGLAFDEQGGRLGYGKGFYDKYFSQYRQRQRPILIGAAYPFQMVAHVPQETTDIRMNHIFLPGRSVTCHRRDLTEDANGIDNVIYHP